MSFDCFTSRWTTGGVQGARCPLVSFTGLTKQSYRAGEDKEEGGKKGEERREKGKRRQIRGTRRGIKEGKS